MATAKGTSAAMAASMVYQLKSYHYWASYLGRSDLVTGIFGENLTAEGLADDEVCIGDRFRIGGTVVEVSQPRDTCYRVGIRLERPEMSALLVAHHRLLFPCHPGRRNRRWRLHREAL
jgi:MOSC domain-containing protein YiiM